MLGGMDRSRPSEQPAEGPVESALADALDELAPTLVEEALDRATRTGRARPLSREDRRTAIAVATIPLLELHGAQVTTRQIALAAGVAEGTLFRAFDDKVELLMSAAQQVMDPTDAVAAIEALPPTATLADEVTQLAEHLAGNARRLRRVMVAVHGILTSEEGRRAPAVRTARGAADEGGHGRFRHGRDAHLRAVSALSEAAARRLDPFRDDLRVEPEVLVRILLATTMGQGPPGLAEDAETPTAQIVDVLLHGTAR
jgi:AcrR family transcriptional regulator